jgi:hypothetical protein
MAYRRQHFPTTCTLDGAKCRHGLSDPNLTPILRLQDTKPWITFDIWARQLNTPIVTVWIGRNPTLWLNESWAAAELLEKRANVYSSRPR